jgi:OOP family OmpA-OmpF porin
MSLSRNVAAFVATLAFSGGAFSQAYIGAGAGPTHLDADCGGTISCNNNGTGIKLYGGYKFAPNIAVEFNYMDFGTAKASALVGASVVNIEMKSKLVGGGVALLSDIAPNWNAAARLGLGSVSTDVKGASGGQTVDLSESSTQAYFGLGIGYAVTKQLSINGAIDFSKTKFSGESANLRFVSVGLTYAF